ncbi:hypothetical protein PM082_000581 [Marasmius tenuissimus]|nr:hypothetical protein PM082_000581 [Marasmius tenuissimus]
MPLIGERMDDVCNGRATNQQETPRSSECKQDGTEALLMSLFPGAGRIDLDGLLPAPGVGKMAQTGSVHPGKGQSTLATGNRENTESKNMTRIRLLREQLQWSAADNLAVREQINTANEELQKVKSVLDLTQKDLNTARDENLALRAHMAEIRPQFLAELDEAMLRSIGICTVCQDEYGPDKLPATNACGHSFCDDCTNELKQRVEACPLCRSNFTGGTRCLALRKLLTTLWSRSEARV